jgi:hypothetical protein
MLFQRRLEEIDQVRLGLGLWRAQGQRHVGQLSTDRPGRSDGRGKRIRWGDLDIVVRGVAQFNSDLTPEIRRV